jgi:hypothetical protein
VKARNRTRTTTQAANTFLPTHNYTSSPCVLLCLFVSGAKIHGKSERPLFFYLSYLIKMSDIGQEKTFFFSGFPLELTRRLLSEFTTGRDLSTLALALITSSTNKKNKSSTTAASSSLLLLLYIQDIIQDRILQLADFIEAKVKLLQEDEEQEAKRKHRVDTASVERAVLWIRNAVAPLADSPLELQEENCATYNYLSHCQKWIHCLSLRAALLDFVHDSIVHFSRPDAGQFEWPVWAGQICIEGSRAGTRLRSTARVVITTPLDRPSFVPGSGLMSKKTPYTLFRGELYNLVPVPPWASVRPMSSPDKEVLQAAATRLEDNNQIACPAGFYHNEILDVRILTLRQAQRLLTNRSSIRPRNEWMIQPPTTTTITTTRPATTKSDAHENHSEERKEDDNWRLLCCWHDDSASLPTYDEYLTYIVNIQNARQRLQHSTSVSCREYIPT